jgi:predicted NBD/HSP70 family sugar kinase
VNPRKTPYSQQRAARKQNASVLLFDLWRNAPLSRAMLAQRNNLTKATVSAICNELAALNLICEAGRGTNGRGRPGNLLELNAMARGVIGLEISTNYVAVLLADFCGQALWRQTTAIPLGCQQEVALKQAEVLLAEAITQAQERALPLLGIGVAVPGWVDSQRGIIIRSATLGWTNLALQSRWEASFSLPVIIENKARAAAMNEALLGAGQGVKNFVYVSIGTDLGSSVDVAVVVNGLPYRGARGLAADAGHMILAPHGELCSCGQRGCWRAQADVSREVGLVEAQLARGEQSVLRDRAADGTLEHRAIHQAVVDGDPLAREVFRKVVTLSHATGILNLITLFDPELVLIGFANVGLPTEFQQRMESLESMVDVGIAEEVRRQMKDRGLTPPVIRRATREPITNMLGAATLLVNDFLRTPPLVGG